MLFGYIIVLKTVVNPWINKVWEGRPYLFLHGSASIHKAIVNKNWLSEIFYGHMTPNGWPLNSLDLNPLEYYVWSVVDQMMFKMHWEYLIVDCRRFGAGTKSVIEAGGEFIEKVDKRV